MNKVNMNKSFNICTRQRVAFLVWLNLKIKKEKIY